MLETLPEACHVPLTAARRNLELRAGFRTHETSLIGTFQKKEHHESRGFIVPA